MILKNKYSTCEFDTGKNPIYPDKPDITGRYIRAAELTIFDQYDIKFATIFVARKG